MIAVELAFERSMRREDKRKVIFPGLSATYPCCYDYSWLFLSSYLFSLRIYNVRNGKEKPRKSIVTSAIIPRPSSWEQRANTWWAEGVKNGKGNGFWHRRSRFSFSLSFSLSLFLSLYRSGEWSRTASSVLARVKKAEDNGATSPCHRVIWAWRNRRVDRSARDTTLSRPRPRRPTAT